MAYDLTSFSNPNQSLERDFQVLWSRLLVSRKKSLLSPIMRKVMRYRPNNISEPEFRNRVLCYLAWKLFKTYRNDCHLNQTPTEWWAEVRFPRALLARLSDQAAKDVVKDFVPWSGSEDKPTVQWLENEERLGNEEHDPLELLLYFLDLGLLSSESQSYRQHVQVCISCQQQLQEAAEQLAAFIDRAGYEDLSIECIKLIRKLGLKKCAIPFLLVGHGLIEAVEDLRDRVSTEYPNAVAIILCPTARPSSELSADFEKCSGTTRPDQSVAASGETEATGDPFAPRTFVPQTRGRYRQDEVILKRTLKFFGYKGSRLYLRQISPSQDLQIRRFMKVVKETAILWLLIRRDAEITSLGKITTVATKPDTLSSIATVELVQNPQASTELLRCVGRRE